MLTRPQFIAAAYAALTTPTLAQSKQTPRPSLKPIAIIAKPESCLGH
jgi:hypothetical protein